MKTKLSVTTYMTAMPHSIGADQSLSVAKKKLHELRVRHLPVLEGGKLVGVLSERDLDVIEGLRGVDANKVTVDEAMSTEVHQVPPSATLDEVAAYMAEHKIGSTLVVDGGKCAGIFTTVDACRALTDLLRGR